MLLGINSIEYHVLTIVYCIHHDRVTLSAVLFSSISRKSTEFMAVFMTTSRPLDIWHATSSITSLRPCGSSACTKLSQGCGGPPDMPILPKTSPSVVTGGLRRPSEYLQARCQEARCHEAYLEVTYQEEVRDLLPLVRAHEGS